MKDNSFAARLKRAREDLGMSVTEFAKFVGTSKQNISSYENGTRSPKIDILDKIANKLGMSISELAGKENPVRKIIPEDHRDDPEIAELITAYLSIPKDRQKQLMEYAEVLQVLSRPNT